MKTLIIGYGVSGKSAEAFLKSRGKECLIVDKRPLAYPVLSEDISLNWKEIELVVKSPGVSLLHPLVVKAREKNIPLLGEIELALGELQKKNKKILAVTGSNGKTTTTLLLAHILGERGIAVGNVGIPLTSEVENKADIFVVEISSFQLEELNLIPFFDAAAILNITPNHLDRYPSFEAYAAAKLRLQHCLKPGAPLLVNKEIAPLLPLDPSKNFRTFQERVECILSLSYRDRILPHDVENFAAAFALAREMGIPESVCKERAQTFIKPPHRIEYVRTVAGVTYVNDSKATSVDAVKKAIAAIQGKIILLAGGVDKGGSYLEWIPFLESKVVGVLAMGEAADRICKEIGKMVLVEKVGSLSEGLKKAQSLAKAGHTILLSPGCASYDQFRDYQHRGEVFKQLVRGIIS